MVSSTKCLFPRTNEVKGILFQSWIKFLVEDLISLDLLHQTDASACYNVVSILLYLPVSQLAESAL